MSNPITNQDNETARFPILRVLGLTALLMVAWLLWSGLFKPLLLALGLFSSLLTIFVLYRMGYFGNETFAFRYGHRLIGFWAWLLKEIVISALEVSRIVLRRELHVRPTTITLDVKNLESVDQALLGNSITLTPGTLTLDAHDGRLLVHALTESAAAELEAGHMERRVAALREN